MVHEMVGIVEDHYDFTDTNNFIVQNYLATSISLYDIPTYKIYYK